VSTPSRFARTAAWCYAHRWRTIGLWLVVVVAAVVVSGAVGTKESNDFRLPGTESQRVYDQLADHFPAQNGDVDQFVFAVREGGVRDAAVRSRIEGALTEVKAQGRVAYVASPFAQGGQISKDGRIAVAQVGYERTINDLDVDEDLRPVEKAAFEARSATLQVEHGGQGAEFIRFEDTQDPSALIGVLAAAIVLIITFGSVFAAGLPLLAAGFALGSSISLIAVVSHIAATPDFATQLAELIGLGVGIDYALLVITRYRSEHARGAARGDAIVTAVDTAGRTVFFAGITVIIALLGLLLMGLNFMQGVAIGAAMAVLFTMVAALTLLPAMIRVVGTWIDGIPRKYLDKLRLPKLRRRDRDPGDSQMWTRWSKYVQKRPWPMAVVGLVALSVLAAPALGMRLGSSDAGTDPEGTTPRKAYDLISEGFGAGINGQFLVAVTLPAKGDTAAATQVAAALKAEKGLAQVTDPQVSPDGVVATITAYPSTGPQDEATTDTLKRLRDDVVPGIEDTTGAQVDIGGLNATIEDFSHAVARKLPLFVGVVVLLSALLLLAVFRSVLIPIKAAVMNLLSIGAALGVVTAIFQDGHLSGLIGIETGPIEPFVPVLLFAIVFGLSMDYEVFLLSRVHEAWEETHDAAGSVARGLATTGRVITAAATIMFLVFGAFTLGDDRVIKLFGVALASAVFIDALIIRCLLVPAIMEVMGRSAWWMPTWLDAKLPRIAIEREPPREVVPEPAS